MFGFVFRSSLYYMLWNKFKTQFITMLVSLVLIVMIFSIYDDLYAIFTVSYQDNLYLLLIGKWSLILLIVGYNWYKLSKLKKKAISSNDSEYNFTDTKIENTIILDIKEELPRQKHHQDILTKPKLKTKTDLILQKYTNNKT